MTRYPVRSKGDAFLVRAPCKGDAFAFQVVVREVWSRPGTADDLALAIDDVKDAYRASARVRLRTISRRFPPNLGALAEDAANKELGHPQSITGEPDLTCTWTFEVRPDEALAEHLREIERARLTAEANHDATRRNMERLEQVEQRWLGLLRNLGRDPLGPALARLVSGPELAEAIDKFVAQQEQNSKELRDLSDTASQAYREKGLWEYATATDSAFNRLLQHITNETGPSLNGQAHNGHRPPPPQ